MRRSLLLYIVLSFISFVFLFPPAADAQKKPILVGFPMILSGGGALFGQPSSVGAEMFVKEINAKGGVLGRPIELIVRDCGNTPEEATRVAREIVLKEKVDFMVGGLTAFPGIALSEVAKTEKVVYIAPISKSTAMTDPDKLHPYVFRAAANTNTEGRSAAVFMAKNPWTKIATLGPDYEFGQMVTKAFVEWMKKNKPEVQIVHQGWPKLGETDYTPFIAPFWPPNRRPLSFLSGAAICNFCQTGETLRLL